MSFGPADLLAATVAFGPGERAKKAQKDARADQVRVQAAAAAAARAQRRSVEEQQRRAQANQPDVMALLNDELQRASGAEGTFLSLPKLGKNKPLGA